MQRDETLMFLPGAGGDTRFWKPVADGLSSLCYPGERRFWGWPGFGGLPADPTVQGIADLTQRVADAITGPTILFAQSMGGVIAVQATLKEPEKVRSLILSVTSGGIDTRSLGGSDWRPEYMKEFPTVPRWFLDEREDLTARLPEIRVPVLLLWGDADPICPVAAGRTLVSLFPFAELVVIPGGQHDLACARVAEVLPHVERHLRK
jgi:poly(3-hydroxyoctanoate) depolymerase